MPHPAKMMRTPTATPHPGLLVAVVTVLTVLVGAHLSCCNAALQLPCLCCLCLYQLLSLHLREQQVTQSLHGTYQAKRGRQARGAWCGPPSYTGPLFGKHSCTKFTTIASNKLLDIDCLPQPLGYDSNSATRTSTGYIVCSCACCVFSPKHVPHLSWPWLQWSFCCSRLPGCMLLQHSLC